METVARIEPLSRRRAAEVAEAELAAFQAVISALEEPDWDRPTDSAGWSVQDVVAHVAGQYEELARLGTFLRRLRLAKRRYPDRIASRASSSTGTTGAGASPRWRLRGRWG